MWSPNRQRGMSPYKIPIKLITNAGLLVPGLGVPSSVAVYTHIVYLRCMEVVLLLVLVHA